MKLVRGELLDAFAASHPDAANALTAWKNSVERGDFRHFVALKTAFGSADYVRPCVVFDLCGNKYRLIASVNYALGFVAVRCLLTHAEYDRGGWRTRR